MRIGLFLSKHIGACHHNHIIPAAGTRTANVTNKILSYYIIKVLIVHIERKKCECS